MSENTITSENLTNGSYLINKKPYNYDTRVLEEVVEYILDNDNNYAKIIEALNIVYEDKNVLMMLLANQKFDSIKKLFNILPIIFSNAKPLLYIDNNGQNVLGYFIEFAPYDLLESVIELMATYCSPEDIKCLLVHKRNDGQTPLMTLCTNKRFQSLELVFQMTIDCLASVCGFDIMYNVLTTSDDLGNNILILAIKHKNFTVGNKILDLLSKTLPNLNDRNKIENEIILSCDNESNNALMLLANQSCDDAKALQDKILEILKNHLDESLITSLGRANTDGNNALMIAIIAQNTHLSDAIMEIIQLTQKSIKISLLHQICNQYNTNNDSFLTLALKNNDNNIYLRLIKEIELTLSSEKIADLFTKTLSLHRNFLHNALSVTNMDTIMSIIGYIKKIKTLGLDEREEMANLIMRKDVMNRNLLIYATTVANIEVSKLILDIAIEFCNPLTLKLMLTSKDAIGNTAYMLSTLQNNQQIQKYLKDFAISTNNMKYIESQDKEVHIIKK